MADSNDVATDTEIQQDPASILADQVRTSYAQTGASDQTLILLRQYVNAVIQASPQEVFTEISQSELQDAVVASLDLGVSDPTITSTVDTQVSDLAAGRACASTTPTQQTVQNGADPIEMFSGQFTQDIIDVTLLGAGIDFVFRRVYKNQAVHFGSLGANWDHSYNLHLRQLGNNVVRSSGELRDDIYTRHPLFGQAGFNYWVPPDGVDGVIEAMGTSFTWRSPNGVRFIYSQTAADPQFHRIQRVEDRFGNYLSFTYLGQLLRQVEIGSASRFVLFDYDTADRIIALTDHTGRKWSYAYDDYGDLVTVTTPATRQYPAGLTTNYEYSSSEFSSPLQHNLLRIIDPAGQLYLENEYGDSVGLLSLNRVIRQRQGSGEYFFEYEAVVSEFEFDYSESEKPEIQVNHIQRNGQMVHLIYNRFGNLLFREEYSWDQATPRLVQCRYRYNRDGRLIGVISPEGNVSQYYYGRDDYLRLFDVTDDQVPTDSNLTASMRLAFGNLLAVVKRGRTYDFAQMDLSRGVWGDFFPDVLAALDPEDIVVKSTFEPDYQQVLTTSDPRFTSRADPRYNEAPAYSQHLTRWEYSPLPLKTLLRVRYPNTSFPVPLPNGTTGLTNITEEYLQYDARGRLERLQDPQGNVTEYRYFPPAVGSPKEGFLHEAIRDANNLRLLTAYDVNDVGRVTSIVNPRGIPTRFTVNELDQTIETISGGPGFRSRALFDENRLLQRQERDNLDDAGQPAPDGSEIRTYDYDEQNNLVRESIGGSDLTLHHFTRYLYDESDKRIATVFPCGNEIRFTYNERLLLSFTIRGGSSPLASTTHFLYDCDGRKTTVVDARNNPTKIAYDTFNRVIGVTDALGGVQQNTYDKAGNLSITRFFERHVDGSYHLLKRQEMAYDERGNKVLELAYLFQSPIKTANITSAPDLEFSTAQGLRLVTPVQTAFFYDRNRQLFRTVNTLGQEVQYQYDGANRLVVQTDDWGNYRVFSYDEMSNVIRIDRHELLKDPASGAVTGEEVFSTVNDYDPLDRQISTMDGLGNRTTFKYDSRNNLTYIQDPLGNVKRYRYDVYDRRTFEIFESTTSGLAGGTRLADIQTQFVCDANDRLTSVIDAKGSETHYSYDDLNRLFQTTQVDGSFMHLTYDPNDNIVVRQDNNRLRAVFQFDPLNRPVRMDLDKSGVNPSFPYPVGVEELEKYTYDGLGRTLGFANDFCSISNKIDSLGRTFEENLQFSTSYAGPAGTMTLRRSFDALSNRTDLTYPSGRGIHYDYDDLNRIVKISNSANGRNYPGSNAFPVKYDIVTYGYRGTRLANATNGNGTVSILAYDGASRLISTRHGFAPAEFLELQQLFDGAGNRRFRLDDPSVAAGPNGESYKFDSLYRLTKIAPATLTAFDVTLFAPPATALPLTGMTGQLAIDAVIGPMAQDPLNLTFQYDAVGNREQEWEPAQPVKTYVPNGLNQYQSVDGTAFAYDYNGNLVDDGQWLYRYNYRNRLVQVLNRSSGAESLRLLYDATGRAIVVKQGLTATFLINDGANVVEEYSGASLSAQWVYENGVDRRCQMTNGGEEWWYHRDLVLSTRSLSDSSGRKLAARYEYDAFGSLVSGPPQYNPYLFGGKRWFAVINVYGLRARHYSPLLGRFLQRDPKDLGELRNLYTYAGNNPVTYVDALGFEKSSVTPSSQVGLEDPIPREPQDVVYTQDPEMAARIREATAGALPEAIRLPGGDKLPYGAPGGVLVAVEDPLLRMHLPSVTEALGMKGPYLDHDPETGQIVMRDFNIDLVGGQNLARTYNLRFITPERIDPKTGTVIPAQIIELGLSDPITDPLEVLSLGLDVINVVTLTSSIVEGVGKGAVRSATTGAFRSTGAKPLDDVALAEMREARLRGAIENEKIRLQNWNFENYGIWEIEGKQVGGNLPMYLWEDAIEPPKQGFRLVRSGDKMLLLKMK